ncbi:MAG: sodium/proton-translocating pyrophosphatase, partial [Armatimonadota bacterium]
IADNVGDNVGDCAGMAADVFESYEVTLVAAIVLGAATASIFDTSTWMKLVLFALMARGVGIVASILGIFMVKGKNDENLDPLTPVRRGFWGSALLAAAGTVFLAWFMMQGIESRYYVDAHGETITGVRKVSFEDLKTLSAIARVVHGQKASPLNPGSQDIEPQPDLSDEDLTEQVNDLLRADRDTLAQQLQGSNIEIPEFTPVSVDSVRMLRGSPMLNYSLLSSRVSSGPIVRIGQQLDSPIMLVKERVALGAPQEGQEPQTSESWSLRLESQLQQASPGVEILEKYPVSLGYGGPQSDGLYWLVQAPFKKSDFGEGNEAYKALASFQPLDYLTRYVEPPDFSAGQPDQIIETGSMAALAEQKAPVAWYLFALAIIAGIFMAYLIEQLTDYFVSFEKKPVREIASTSTAGPAPMIIQGFAYGLESSVWALLAIVLALVTPLIIFPPALYGGFILSFYGIALVGLGLLTTTGYILAMDTFGPISDNAQGVYEMSGAHKLEKTEEGSMAGSRAVQRLDAAGNTTKALTKGFAIATAVVAAVALFHSFIEDAYLVGKGLPIDIPQIFLGLLIGGAVPFLFSAFSINAVGRAAFLLIQEVRRQFAADPGILKGTSKPNYGNCVAIVTAAAQKELLGPGLLAICFPVLVGFGFAIGGQTVEIAGVQVNITGAQALGGFLAGSILSGQLLAVLLANSGGAWDNAKKLIEDGNFGGKGSEAHKAGVVCDTVGDPFKDTAGPALNPLIKVMNLVALLMAGTLVMPMADWIRYTAVGASVVGIIIAVYWSKRGSLGTVLQQMAEQAAGAPAVDSGAATPPPPHETSHIKEKE